MADKNKPMKTKSSAKPPSKHNRKYGSNTGGRGADGKFGPGNPGKPKGARHKVTQAVAEILEGDGEALARKAVELALEGNMKALHLCIARLLPPKKDTPVTFEIPPMETADDAVTALGAIMQAVADGEITPAEGSTVGGLIEGFRKALETQDLERRIIELENAK